MSCNGGNLKYAIQGGQTPPATPEMTIDFGSGVVCAHDASGNLTVLSSNDFREVKVVITPNPTSGVLNYWIRTV